MLDIRVICGASTGTAARASSLCFRSTRCSLVYTAVFPPAERWYSTRLYEGAWCRTGSGCSAAEHVLAFTAAVGIIRRGLQL